MFIIVCNSMATGFEFRYNFYFLKVYFARKRGKVIITMPLI